MWKEKQMDFTPITTQEEFDAAIKSRLEREKNKYSEQLAEFDAVKTELADAKKQVGDLTGALNDAKEKISKHDSEIAERDSKIAAYETASVKTRVAHEMGLSFDAVDFLQGNDEESIRKSAESLKTLVGAAHVAPRAGEQELSNDGDAKKNAELKEMVSKLRKG